MEACNDKSSKRFQILLKSFDSFEMSKSKAQRSFPYNMSRYKAQVG